MTASQIIFYLISGLMLVSAALTVTTRRVFRAAIYLMGVLLMVAGLYFFLSFNFLAAVQILIYAGGVVVIIIFAVLLTRSGELLPKPPALKPVMGGILSLAAFILVGGLIAYHGFQPTSSGELEFSFNLIGQKLFDLKNYGYVLAFELVGLLLLIALITSIFIAMKPEPWNKSH